MNFSLVRNPIGISSNLHVGVSTQMSEVMAVAVGGALGALSRFALTTWVRHYWASPFPVATFLVNVAGSIALGYVLTVLPAKPAGTIWVALMATGFLGSFTTFSTFSWETIALVRSGSVGLALLYVALSLVTSFVGVFVGLSLGSRTLD